MGRPRGRLFMRTDLLGRDNIKEIVAEADMSDSTGWSSSCLRWKEGEGLTARPRRSAGGREARGSWLGVRLGRRSWAARARLAPAACGAGERGLALEQAEWTTAGRE